jgi:hypothetical protein
MKTKGRQIHILFVNAGKHTLNGFRIIPRMTGKNNKKAEEMNIHVVNISQYIDLLTKCGPAYKKTFSWLKKPLKIMDHIAKLKNLRDI